MNLKELLGEKYKDGMTFDDVSAALADIDPNKGFVKKDLFDRTASELAASKKQLKEKMTADEAAEAERAAAQKKMEQELADLKKDKEISQHKAKFLGLGFNEDMAEKSAKALADGDMETVFANQKKHQEDSEKALRAEILKGTHRPPAGEGGGIDFAKEAIAAQQAGDFTKAAYYTRLAGQAAENT